MNNFDSYYFLHIQKTAGRYFRENIHSNIIYDIKETGIKNLDVDDFAHWGWRPEINDNTYVVTLFRDPVAQIVSLFCHVVKDFCIIDKKRKDKYYIYADKNIDKKLFFDWLPRNLQYVSNFQSRSLMYHGVMSMETDDLLNATSYSLDDVKERMNRINLNIKVEDFAKINYIDVIKKIRLDLGIQKTHLFEPKYEKHENKESKEILDSLTQLEKNKILAIFDIDAEIYNTDSYFWKP